MRATVYYSTVVDRVPLPILKSNILLPIAEKMNRQLPLLSSLSNSGLQRSRNKTNLGRFQHQQQRGIIFLAFPPLLIGGIMIMGLGGIAMSAYNKRQRQQYQEKLDKETSSNRSICNNKNDTNNYNDSSSDKPKQH